MLTAKELSALLAARAEDVARYLLPTGKMESGNWRVGDISGGPGDSVGVQVKGHNAGLWSDFATGTEKGDLLDLWASVRRIALRDAFREAKEWLGIHNPTASNPPKSYSRPNPKGIISIRKQSVPPVEAYLMTERKLSKEVIIAYQIGCKESTKADGGLVIAFPRKSLSGELLNVKYLGLQRTEREDGKLQKQTWQEKDCAPSLFGWQVIDVNAKEILITEGEIDCMTWWDWGFQNSLSVPNGVAGDQWIDYDWDNLEHFDRIFLSFDMDKPGQEAVTKIAHRLGIHRCFIVKLPEKDANDCLRQGYDGGHAAQFLKESRPISPKEIKQVSDFLDQAINLLTPQDDDSLEAGLKTPIFGRRFRFRPGEMTLWTGHTSHGKTTLLNQILVTAIIRGQRVAMGSFEMTGARLLHKFSSCISLADELNANILQQTCDWMGDRLWIYDMMGIAKRDRLMELMHYSVRRHGVSHIVIDSLMKCDVSADDYEVQRQFINQLHSFGIEHHVHIHLVGHPRKSDSDKEAPGTMDVHGGQAVVGQPDNIVAVWRNRDKESKREDNKLPENQEKNSPDTIVFVRKQRATGDEYKVWLWFNRKWNRFTAHKNPDSGEPEFEDYGIVQKELTLQPEMMP